VSAWQDLGLGLRVRQSRLYAMNSAVLTAGDWALVVDPGVLPSELDDLAAQVAAQAPRFERVALVYTHPHWDHVLGGPWFPAASSLAHVGFADELERDRDHIERETRSHVEAAGERWPRRFEPFAPTLTLRGTVGTEVGPFEIVAYDTPGHSASHLALWLPQPRALIAGDLLSDFEIPWLDAAPWVYRRSLTQLHWLLEQEDVRVLVPGHGAVAHGRVDAYRRVLRDLDYLLVLEQRVADARQRGWSLAEAQTALADMAFTGRDDPASDNHGIHRTNIAHAYAAADAHA
jgi:glyoxylase-like metal-dependent hydrolase (beta-lactamase superfamily II)